MLFCCTILYLVFSPPDADRRRKRTAIFLCLDGREEHAVWRIHYSRFLKHWGK
nr:MAG TPA: hypothetical protein [Caudoviricetes sp.]